MQQKQNRSKIMNHDQKCFTPEPVNILLRGKNGVEPE